MKGNLTNSLIAVMVGAVLIFSVVGPILGNATLGTEYLNETWTNDTVQGNTYQYAITNCYPLGTSNLHAWNSTGDALTVTIGSASTGNLTLTNNTILPAEGVLTSYNGTVSYRCQDSNYISNTVGRTVANVILPLVLVVLLVGLTAFII